MDGKQGVDWEDGMGWNGMEEQSAVAVGVRAVHSPVSVSNSVQVVRSCARVRSFPDAYFSPVVAAGHVPMPQPYLQPHAG
jgi:hypothetical protein